MWLTSRFAVKERKLEGKMLLDFAKRMEMAVVNIYLQKREEHRMTYKSGGRNQQVDLKEIGHCDVLKGESLARQHWMVSYRMTTIIAYLQWMLGACKPNIYQFHIPVVLMDILELYVRIYV